MNNLGGFKAVFAVAVALVAVSCTPSGDQQSSAQEKYFDVTGWAS